MTYAEEVCVQAWIPRFFAGRNPDVLNLSAGERDEPSAGRVDYTERRECAQGGACS